MPISICRHRQAGAELIPIPRGKRTATSRDLKPINIVCNHTEPTDGEWNDIKNSFSTHAHCYG